MMFSHLFDLGKKRTALQAIGFYIAYFVMVVVAAAIVSGVTVTILSPATYEESYEIGVWMGTVTATICCTALGILMLQRKHLLGSPVHWALAILAGALAMAGGALLGLLPISMLTTAGKHAASHSSPQPRT